MMHASVRGMPDPTVGMGVTILHWTDRSVGTVVAVHSPTHVEFTEDETKADQSKPLGMGHQDWIHTPQPNGTRRHAMRHTDGRWYEASPNRWGKLAVTKKSQPLALGSKDYNHDWGF